MIALELAALGASSPLRAFGRGCPQVSIAPDGAPERRLPPLSLLPGHGPGPRRQVIGRGKGINVGPDLGEDGAGRCLAHTRDRRQQPDPVGLGGEAGADGGGEFLLAPGQAIELLQEVGQDQSNRFAQAHAQRIAEILELAAYMPRQAVEYHLPIVAPDETALDALAIHRRCR